MTCVKIRKTHLLLLVCMLAIALTGCRSRPQTESFTASDASDAPDGAAPSGECSIEAQKIAECCQDLYHRAAETGTVGMPEAVRRIVERLGEHGYVAVDSKNQVNMTKAERVLEFCRAADSVTPPSAVLPDDDGAARNELTIVEVTYTGGFFTYDLELTDKTVTVERGSYEFDADGALLNKSTARYPADVFRYTEEGYLMLEGSYRSKENYVLTLSDTTEYAAFRVLPLEEACREQNRKYILPVGYSQNNLFLSEWSEADFGELDFYDLFDRLYPLVFKQPVPYAADENLGVGAVYSIPEEVFERVIQTYFQIDRKTLRSKTEYSREDAAYVYRPRGFQEAEYPDIPYPETVRYAYNPDGTITLFVHAVYPQEHTSKAWMHRTVIRPLPDGGFQYVSNCTDGSENGAETYDAWWHTDRLTKEKWEEIYGRNEGARLSVQGKERDAFAL